MVALKLGWWTILNAISPTSDRERAKRERGHERVASI